MSESPMPRWVWVGLAFVSVGLLGLLVPDRYEGAVLVPISPGHGLSLLDGLALGPLLLGVAIVFRGLWTRRHRLLAVADAAPIHWSVGVFGYGFGLGLLLASAFSTVWWWWAIGAAIVTVVLVAAIAIAIRSPCEQR